MHVKLFEQWISEATTEATEDEIKNLLGLMVPIIKKSVDDTIRIEMDYAKRLGEVENDNERSKLFMDLNAKRTLQKSHSNSSCHQKERFHNHRCKRYFHGQRP